MLKMIKHLTQDKLMLLELEESIQLLENQEQLMEAEFGKNNRSFKPYLIMSLYTTFILEEPVHPVGTPFPGGLKVRKENRYLLLSR